MPHVRTPRRLAALAAALLALPTPAVSQGMLALLAGPGDYLRERHLLVPVRGVHLAQLHDTYNEARSGGRVHDAIDIHAPRGTPVLAVTGGTVRKLHTGERGGISLYELDDDGRTRYYYAHLDHYADGMAEGVRVERGQVIGYVGDTGNAQPGDFHLHFSIAVLDDPSRWWEGMNVNPFEILATSGVESAE